MRITKGKVFRDYSRYISFGVMAIGIAVANAGEISTRSDKGKMVVAVRDSVVWVHATAPSGGAWVSCGFSLPGTIATQEATRWIDEGSSEFGFPIPQGSKACMLHMYDRLNREGMCPISGGVCEVKARGLVTGHDGCFCKAEWYDVLGWIYFTGNSE